MVAQDLLSSVLPGLLPKQEDRLRATYTGHEPQVNHLEMHAGVGEKHHGPVSQRELDVAQILPLLVQILFQIRVGNSGK